MGIGATGGGRGKPYNIAGVVRLSLERWTLRRSSVSFVALVGRHETFRTRFASGRRPFR